MFVLVLAWFIGSLLFLIFFVWENIKKISLFMSWNAFPNYISKALLHRLKSNVRYRDVINEININKENVTKIFFHLSYKGSKSQQLLKHSLNKIRRCLKINVTFVAILVKEKNKIP